MFNKNKEDKSTRLQKIFEQAENDVKFYNEFDTFNEYDKYLLNKYGATYGTLVRPYIEYFKSEFYLGKNKIVCVECSINDLIDLERQGLILIIKASEVFNDIHKILVLEK